MNMANALAKLFQPYKGSLKPGERILIHTQQLCETCGNAPDKKADCPACKGVGFKFNSVTLFGKKLQ